MLSCPPTCHCIRSHGRRERKETIEILPGAPSKEVTKKGSRASRLDNAVSTTVRPGVSGFSFGRGAVILEGVGNTP